ncbi:DUF1330 domain-containing protein [Burkholderia sp. GS2Y]|uniref:DUF1330 domain-containing protein n=1 Tax=Burkholderia theae TaxID=3143496 RepID=A0ABU9WJN8_9BURK
MGSEQGGADVVPDEAAARRFIESPEYQAISVDRHAGADTLALLVHGLPAPGA